MYIYIHISTTLYHIYIWLYMCIWYIYTVNIIYTVYSIHNIYIYTYVSIYNSMFCYLYILSVVVIVYIYSYCSLYIYISLFIAYTDFDIGFIIGECDWTMLWVAKRYDFLTRDFVKTWDINQASSERGYAENLAHPFEQCMCYTSCAWTQTLCHHEGSAQITNR